jgi:DNA-directed RNA polymerase specialized sigma24 family protein
MSKTAAGADEPNDDQVRRRLLAQALERIRDASRRERRRTLDSLPADGGGPADDDWSQSPGDARLRAALEALARAYPQAARVLLLRTREGLGAADAAKVLGVSESAVKKDWAFARSWLRHELDRADG